MAKHPRRRRRHDRHSAAVQDRGGGARPIGEILAELLRQYQIDLPGSPIPADTEASAPERWAQVPVTC